MTQEQRVALYEAWTAMDQASSRMVSASVATATSAAERLTEAREKLKKIVWEVTADEPREEYPDPRAYPLADNH